MKIVCLGDSLTFGNVGYSYIHFLDKHIRCINKGKNGDTLRGAYGRVGKFIDRPGMSADVYILGIGTNDITLPYIRSLSPFWRALMTPRCKIMQCIEDDEVFYREYDRMLAFLAEHNKRAVLFGIPCVNLQDFPHHTAQKRNAMIAELAEKYRFPFVDIYALQVHTLPESRIHAWKHGYLLRVWDAAIMTLLPFTKDFFARARKLRSTVDGVHFNSASAKMLAAEIEKALKKLSQE